MDQQVESPAPASAPALEQPVSSATTPILRGVVERLLADLRKGEGDRDKRRQVEEWMKSLAEKYPEFGIEKGLRDYYLAEAERLRSEFESSTDLTERLNLGRSVEGFLDKASDIQKRMTEPPPARL